MGLFTPTAFNSKARGREAHPGMQRRRHGDPNGVEQCRVVERDVDACWDSDVPVIPKPGCAARPQAALSNPVGVPA